MPPKRITRKAANSASAINAIAIASQTDTQNQTDNDSTQTQNMTSNISMNFLINSISTFSGNAFELNFFFESLKDTQELNSLSDKQILIILKQKLTGEAKQFYIEEPAFAEASTLDEFKNIFSNYFRQVKFPENEWNNLKMSPEETYVQIAHKINKLAFKTFPNMPEENMHNIKLVKLKDIVPNLIKQKLLKKNFTNFQEAINYLQKNQDITSSFNKSFEIDSIKTNCNQEVNSLNVSQNLENKQNKPNYARQRNKFQSKTNFNKSFHNQNKFKQGRTFPNRPNIKCHFCGKLNHVIKDCFSFKRYMSGQMQNTPQINNMPTPAITQPTNFTSDTVMPFIPTQLHMPQNNNNHNYNNTQSLN